VTIGSWDRDRGGRYSLSEGVELEVVRQVLPLFFPDIAFAGTSKLTPDFLATVDMLILTSASSSVEQIDPLSVAEQAVLVDFVLGGGNVLLLGDRTGLSPTATKSMMSPFGVEVDGNLLGSHTITIADPTAHPITHEPFGEVSTTSTFNAAWFTELGGARPLARLQDNGEPVLAVFEAGELGPGSGRLVLAADQNLYKGNLILAANTIAYLSVPEPATVCLALAGLPMVWLLIRRRVSRC
jgi:hypothetical protein